MYDHEIHNKGKFNVKIGITIGIKIEKCIPLRIEVNRLVHLGIS